MAKRMRAEHDKRPHVALLVETSLISGREILRGISRYVQERAPWAIYHEPRSLETAAPAWLKTWQGDGLIVRLQNQNLAEAVRRTGLPAIDVLGVAADARIPLVHVDNTLIGQTAAEHLLERGLRHFGYCGFAKMNWAGQRQRAFEETLHAAGFECKTYPFPSYTRSDSSWETQQDRLAAWIQRLPKPVGIMSCYDPVGQRVLDACQRADVAVPEQVAVIGVDNDVTVCEVCKPPLSSVVANHVRVGYEAAALLDQLMRGARAPTEPVYIEPQGMVTRQSTDVLAVGDRDVAAALELIHQHACDGLTVRDVIEHVSISYSAMKGRFQHVMGRSIHDEIVHTQLKQVQELLTRSDLPLHQIAQMAGFRHQEYMGFVFRKKLGKTPGQYRREAHRKR